MENPRKPKVRGIIATSEEEKVSPTADPLYFLFRRVLHIFPGMPLPERIPLCIEHSGSAVYVVGRAENLRVESIPRPTDENWPLYGILGDLVFANTTQGKYYEYQVLERNVGFLSVGYHPVREIRLEWGRRLEADGISYLGPLSVVLGFRMAEATPTIHPVDWNCRITVLDSITESEPAQPLVESPYGMEHASRFPSASKHIEKIA